MHQRKMKAIRKNNFWQIKREKLLLKYMWNTYKKQKLMEIANRIHVRYKYTFKVKASTGFCICALSFEHRQETMTSLNAKYFTNTGELFSKNYFLEWKITKSSQRKHRVISTLHLKDMMNFTEIKVKNPLIISPLCLNLHML